MSLLDDIRAAMGEVQADPELNALRFRHQATWSDGTHCRFSLQDPSKTDAGVRMAQRLTGTDEVTDVLLLRVHPDDPRPDTGAEVPWDYGTARLVSWGTPSDFTGQAVGVCRLTG